jgi:flavin-dependent dehydrogenase
MAASLHLSRAGLRVLCLERGHNSDPVGESLDWSAPELLAELGLPMDRLISEGLATYKRHVLLQLEDGRERDYEPGGWLARPPWNVELRTLHVDRSLLYTALIELVRGAGVEMVSEAAVRVEHDGGRRVLAVTTESGRRIASPWFVDASGASARLFPRTFDLPACEYGPAKVAMWSYFDVPESIEGTTIYGAVDGPYMEWVWQIPIHRSRVSVGYVAVADHVKRLRSEGRSVKEIFEQRLRQFPSLCHLPEQAGARQPRVVSFRCRVHDHFAGPNWVVMGEAAAMIDPMTSNGVTAALRQAREGAELIRRGRERGRIPRLAAMAYTCRFTALARLFNSGIERIMYAAPVRSRAGALAAGDLYTVPAWLMNLLYTRMAPRSLPASCAFALMAGALRGAAAAVEWSCGLGGPARPAERAG